MWRAAKKIVFSTTLASTSSGNTALERTFDVEAIRRMKAGETQDLTVGGGDLAAQAFGAGLVDEYHVYFWQSHWEEANTLSQRRSSELSVAQ